MNGTCTDTIFGSPPPVALGRGQKFNFLNMVMWHINLNGKNSIPGYTENFKPTIKLVTLGWGQRVIRFLPEHGDCCCCCF